MEDIVEMYVDGASKGNHDKNLQNDSYICVIAPEIGITIMESKKWLTNNEAEWEAFLEALKLSRTYKLNKVKIYSDSKLVVEQFNGNWQCKDEKMMGYYVASKSFADFIEVELVWIPREKNLAGIKLEEAFA